MKNSKQKALEDSEIDSIEDSSGTNQVKAEDNAGVSVTLPEEAKEPLASPTTDTEHVPQARDVQVESHLPDLLAGITIPVEEEERAKEQRDLDQTIHKLLIAGLAISVSLMLFGLLLDLTLRRVIPTAIPHLREIFARVILLRPSGFLSLGLLVLIATPVVRVIGSFFAFLYERDWRYAGLTFLVLLIVMLSIVLGKG